MGAPRKNPPSNAAAEIRTLAATGFSLVGIAAHFRIAKETLGLWFERHGELAEAFEIGRDQERQALHNVLYLKAIEKNDTLCCLAILNSRHGYRDPRQQRDSAVEVNIAPVMVVTSHGTDTEWATKVVEQQKKLALHAPSPMLSNGISEPEMPSVESRAVLSHIPGWMPQESQHAPVLTYDTPDAPEAPSYSPAWKRNA